MLIASHGYEKRRAYSISAAPEDAKQTQSIELLVGVDATGSPGAHLTLEPGTFVDVPSGNAAVNGIPVVVTPM